MALRAPSINQIVIDRLLLNGLRLTGWAIQVFGGGGTSNDFGLAAAYATARLLRLAEGPDEAHRDQLARLEFKRQLTRNDRGGVANGSPALSNRALGLHA